MAFGVKLGTGQRFPWVAWIEYSCRRQSIAGLRRRVEKVELTDAEDEAEEDAEEP